MSEEYELKFDPKTIEHLGVKMYSTLPPALAELISNAYDADASEVKLQFHEQNGKPVSITVNDDGYGMSSNDIQTRFLVIGRNRRSADGDTPSPRFGRLPTGKKGLGKLALFGLAEKITVDSTKNKSRNRFHLDWNKLLNADGTYNPETELRNQSVNGEPNTIIKLSNLKRKTSFDLEGLADSLSRIFIVDDDFRIILKHTNGKTIIINNDRRYAQIMSQFEWKKEFFNNNESEYFDKIELKFITTKTPISPSSGLRGITLFSRGKLVNSPEFFSNSTSSHFFQYLTGWISADFIDLLDEDVISTNRQSINWENEKMADFRNWLSELVSKVGTSWRKKRKIKKDDDFKYKTGIDKQKWFSTLPADIQDSAEQIVATLSNDDGVDESFSPVVSALHTIIPEYPNLHWRHLHPEIQEASIKGYTSQNYYTAFLEAIKRYANRTREYSGIHAEQDSNLMGSVFGPEEGKPIKVAEGYFRANGTNFADNTIKNIEGAQRKLSQGVIEGGRNVVAHEEAIDLSKSNLFSETDCLDLLSLISHLMCRIDAAKNMKAK